MVGGAWSLEVHDRRRCKVWLGFCSWWCSVGGARRTVVVYGDRWWFRRGHRAGSLHFLTRKYKIHREWILESGESIVPIIFSCDLWFFNVYLFVLYFFIYFNACMLTFDFLTSLLKRVNKILNEFYFYLVVVSLFLSNRVKDDDDTCAKKINKRKIIKKY